MARISGSVLNPGKSCRNYRSSSKMPDYPLAPNAGVSAPAGQDYEYDAANRLTKVRRSSDNQLLLEIGYDALGRRVETKEYVSPVDGSVLSTPNWTWRLN